MTKEQPVPVGTLKHVDIEDIDWDKRYREELGDLDTLSESIKDKGILQPITIAADGKGRYKLLAGERRITAAEKAGLTKVPALIRKSEGEIDAREIELIENVFRKDFTWAEEAALIQEIDRLYKAKNMDWSGRKTAQLLNKGVASVARALQLATAMETLPELSTIKTADEALKVVKKIEEEAIVKELRTRQDSNKALAIGIKTMLKIADANYNIGDVFIGLAEMRSSGMVGLIECDPPYGINLNEQKRSKDSVVSTVHAYDEIPTAEYPAFLKKLCKELYRVAGKDCWLIFWFGPTWHCVVSSELREAGWLVDDIPGIWVKTQGQTMQPDTYLARAYEPFFICRKGKPQIMKRGRLNVFNFAGASGKIHATERPIPLIEELLTTFHIADNVVCIPFLGSGNTLRACYNLGVKGLGWDISKEYKDKFLLAVEQDSIALGKDDS